MAKRKSTVAKKVVARKGAPKSRTPRPRADGWPSVFDLKRILVPIDFSDYSKRALKYAIPFAQQFKASIDLVYVVEPAIYPADFSFGQVGFPNVEDEIQKGGTEELEAMIKNEIAGRVEARQVIRTGKPFYEIDQHAREAGVDLIIIATHGHTGVEHNLPITPLYNDVVTVIAKSKTGLTPTLLLH